MHATLKYLRDKTVDRLIKHTKGKRTCKSHENFKSHRLAVCSSFAISIHGPGIWIVSNNENEYIIKKTSLLMKCCNCICQFCDICIHQFSCTCPNYFINSIICKHIHFVVLQNPVNVNVNNSSQSHFYNSLMVEEPGVIENKVEEVSAVNECLSFFNATNSQNVSRCDHKDKILKELSNLQILVNSYDFTPVNDSVFQQVISNLHTAKNLLQLPSSSKQIKESFKDTKQLSACQNITPQKRFFSTQKKKKRTKEVIKNPNRDESKEILATLKGVNIPYISTTSTFDHNYYEA